MPVKLSLWIRNSSLSKRKKCRRAVVAIESDHSLEFSVSVGVPACSWLLLCNSRVFRITMWVHAQQLPNHVGVVTFGRIRFSGVSAILVIPRSRREHSAREKTWNEIFFHNFQFGCRNKSIVALGIFCQTQEKVDELQMELDSTKLDLEHAQLSAKENEAAARALRFAR